MAERRPPGFNVDLGFYDSPEVLSIPRKIRASAIGVWTLAGAYSASKLTDGEVSDEKLKELGCTPVIRAALMATTPEPLWVASNAHPSAIQFTRWPKWQRTCAEVKAYRGADAERKRLARESKRNASTSTNSETSGRTTVGRPKIVRADSRDPKSESESESLNTSPLTLVEGGPGGDPKLPATAGKPAAKRRTQIRDDYKPPPTVIATIRTENPGIGDEHIRYQHNKFIDHWKKTGRPMADWDAAWRNWMRTASERGEFARAPNGHATSARPHDDKVNSYLAFANPTQSELE
jgi:hypothetical protein